MLSEKISRKAQKMVHSSFKVTLLITTTLFVIMISMEMNGQSYFSEKSSGWTLSTSFQVTGGNYFYDEYNTLYFLYGGIRYQYKNFSLNGYIPVVAQNRPGYTQSGMMVIPTGTEGGGSGGMMDRSTMHGGNNSGDKFCDEFANIFG